MIWSVHQCKLVTHPLHARGLLLNTLAGFHQLLLLLTGNPFKLLDLLILPLQRLQTGTNSSALV